MEASKLPLQAMSRLRFLCRLCEHILTNSNAPFSEKFIFISFSQVRCGESVSGEWIFR